LKICTELPKKITLPIPQKDPVSTFQQSASHEAASSAVQAKRSFWEVIDHVNINGMMTWETTIWEATTMGISTTKNGGTMANLMGISWAVGTSWD